MYRQRKTDRGRSRQRSSGHGWTVPGRGAVRAKEGLRRCLCAEGEGERTSVANERGGDGDGEAAREVEGEKETKKRGGK